MKTIEIADRVELTVIRPNGTKEVVTHPTIKALNEAQFQQIKKATKEAGRGDALFYRNYTKKVKINPRGPYGVSSEDDEIVKMMRMGE